MSGRYYIVQDGAKLWADTKAAARRLAQLAADATGLDVPVYPAPKPRKISARRNPDPMIYADHFWRMDRVRRDQAAHQAKTAGAAKRQADAGGKYMVVATTRKETWRFARKGKAAADRLAEELRDRGCKVTVALANPTRKRRASRKPVQAARRRRVAT